MDKVKENLAKIRLAIADEYKRLDKSSYSAWAKSKAHEIEFALKRIDFVIAVIEDTREDESKIYSIADEFFKSPDSIPYDMELSQFSKTALFSMDAILDFKLKFSFTEKTDCYDFDGVPFVSKAGTDSYMSIRESLGIARLNPFHTISWMYYGPAFGTFFGKTTALSAVESKLSAMDKESSAGKSI